VAIARGELDNSSCDLDMLIGRDTQTLRASLAAVAVAATVRWQEAPP
jgi:hypothetical protein